VALVGHRHQRLVDERRVVAVGGVVPAQLPVSVDRDPARIGPHLDLPVRRPHPPLVQHLRRRTEVFGQRWNVGVERPEHQPFAHLDTGESAEPVAGTVEAIAVRGRERDGHTSTIVRVRPPVIGAGESLLVAPSAGAQLHSAMHASVQQRVDAAVSGAGHDHGSTTDRNSDEVVRFGDLALVGEEHPCAAEDEAHLIVEQFGVGVGGAVDPGTVEQACPSCGHGDLLVVIGRLPVM
jgi:hypothetical protein